MKNFPGKMPGSRRTVLFLAGIFLLTARLPAGDDCLDCGEKSGRPETGTPPPLGEYYWPDAPTPHPRSWSEVSVEPTPELPVSETVISPSPSPPAAITCEADRLRYSDGGKLITAEGNVRIGYKTILLTADKAKVYLDRKEAYAEGNVVLAQGDNVIASDKIRYDFISEKGIMSPGEGYYDPWFGRADILETEGREKVEFYGGAATTCDEEEPHYRLQAGRLIIYPDDKLVAHNVTFYLGKVPVFWLPYFRRSLKDDCRGFFLYPGYRNKWGFFFLSGYHWCLPGLNTTFHLDYRYRRGLAYGFDGQFYPGYDGKGEWQTYYLQDQGYEDDAGEESTTERYLLEYKYRQPLPYQIGSYLALSYASDNLIRKDYFRREYNADTQPKSYLYLDRRWSDITLSLEVRPRLNDFYRVIEKLPEVKLQVQEFQLGESDFYYQGQNSYAYLTRKDADISSTRYESGRFDTFHQLSYSRKLFGWLNVFPTTSLRYNFYTRGPDRSEVSGSGEEAPEPSPTPEPVEERDFWRRVFSAGLGLSTDIYGVFPVQTEWLDIDRLRHVITPSVNYVFTDKPTVDSGDIYQFDSIDKISRRNYFLLNLRNQLQTKRGSEEEGKTSWTLVDLIISTPLYIRPERDNSDRLIGDFSGKLKITPYSRIGLNLDLVYDSYDNRFKSDTLDLWVRPEDDFWVTFSHSYRSDPGRNQVSAEVYLRVNPVWAFKIYGRYDTLEDRFEEESFTIYRDLHCWMSSLEFQRRDDEDEYTFFLSFWIKEFSQAPLRLSN